MKYRIGQMIQVGFWEFRVLSYSNDTYVLEWVSDKNNPTKKYKMKYGIWSIEEL